MIFAPRLIPDETSAVALITDEAMEVLAQIFEVPIAEETKETPTSISEMPNILGIVLPIPIEAMDTKRGSEEGPKKEPGTTPVAILEDMVMWLVVELLVPVLGA